MNPQNMALLVALGSLLLLFAVCPLSHGHGSKKALPEGMHRDMYCIGCEMTMKVVDRALRNVPRDQLDVLIPEALHGVCKPDHLEISEFSKHSLSEACEHLIAEHGKLMEAMLLSHYSRDSRPTYLDMVQRVCLDLTDACHGVMHDAHDHDPLKDDARVKLDLETNKFVVLPGKNLKVAKPLTADREEL